MSYRQICEEIYGKMTNEPQQSMHPCGGCGTPSDRTKLSEFAGLCDRCRQAFCTSALPVCVKPELPSNLANSPKAWAHRLQAREESGERLTLGQKSAWRTALRPVVASQFSEENE